MSKKLRATNPNVWPSYFTWLTLLFLAFFFLSFRIFMQKSTENGFANTADLWSLVLFMAVFGIQTIVFACLDHKYFFKHWSSK